MSLLRQGLIRAISATALAKHAGVAPQMWPFGPEILGVAPCGILSRFGSSRSAEAPCSLPTFSIRCAFATGASGDNSKETPSSTAPAASSSEPSAFVTQAARKTSAAERVLQASGLEPDDADFKTFNMTPEEIVQELDKHIIGQLDAKRAVAVAMRSRWRRQQLAKDSQGEVHPVNILLIGPTGSGKTEVARRVAKLAGAPFTTVEATRYTQVGIVGPNTDSIIKDLADSAFKDALEKQYVRLRHQALPHAEDVLIGVLKLQRADFADVLKSKNQTSDEPPSHDQLRAWLREGVFDADYVDIEMPSAGPDPSMMPVSMAGGDEGAFLDLTSLFNQPRGRPRSKPRRVPVADALKALVDSEAAKLADKEAAKASAVRATEQTGIVFLDEIDKLSRMADERSLSTGGSIGEGVQKELLSLIEGTVVNTKIGPVRTNHILFIGSGSFYHVKPTDLLPELQGRLPIKVMLKPLTEPEFARILVEPKFSVLQQQQALLRTESVDLQFAPDAIAEIARVAHHLNTSIENTGARRLQSVLAAVMSDISFEASSKRRAAVEEARARGDAKAEEVMLVERVDAAYVRSKVEPLMVRTDLSKYVL